MPLRKAKYTDLTEIATLLSKSFYNDPLNEYFFPNREKYPDDYLRDFTHELMISWWKYDRVWIVSYDDGTTGAGAGAGAGAGGDIKGVICWARRGEPVNPLWDTKWWDLRRHILSPLAITTHTYQRKTTPNPSTRSPSPTDPTPLQKRDFGSTMAPFVIPLLSPPHLPQNHYEICTLAVHPSHQRRGVGAELVSWGLERAKAEGVPCVVISSTGSEAFYGSMGFTGYLGCAGRVERVGEGGEVVGNPMVGRVETGGDIFRTEG